MNLPALSFAFSLAVLAAIHVNLYRRHRRAVATLQRVRRERDNAQAACFVRIIADTPPGPLMIEGGASNHPDWNRRRA